MSLRSVRIYLSVARHFSTEAARRGTVVASSGGGGDTLGRRLLSLVYPKRSAVIAINKWKEEGHTLPRKYQLNRMIRELRKNKRYKHALEVRSLHARFLIFIYILCIKLIFC
jgi:hypothetical protein